MNYWASSGFQIALDNAIECTLKCLITFLKRQLGYTIALNHNFGQFLGRERGASKTCPLFFPECFLANSFFLALPFLAHLCSPTQNNPVQELFLAKMPEVFCWCKLEIRPVSCGRKISYRYELATLVHGRAYGLPVRWAWPTILTRGDSLKSSQCWKVYL